MVKVVSDFSASKVLSTHTDELDTAHLQLDTLGKGCAYFIYQVPKQANRHDFPAPEIKWDGCDGYLDFSDGHEKTEPKVFNQRFHMMGVPSEGIVLVGVQGRVPALWHWAQNWVNVVSQDPKYAAWTKDLRWLAHVDVDVLGGPLVEQETEDLGPTVDLDDQSAVEKLVYNDAEPTQAEVDKILDEGPTDAEREEMDRLRSATR